MDPIRALIASCQIAIPDPGMPDLLAAIVQYESGGRPATFREMTAKKTQDFEGIEEASQMALSLQHAGIPIRIGLAGVPDFAGLRTKHAATPEAFKPCRNLEMAAEYLQVLGWGCQPIGEHQPSVSTCVAGWYGAAADGAPSADYARAVLALVPADGAPVAASPQITATTTKKSRPVVPTWTPPPVEGTALFYVPGNKPQTEGSAPLFYNKSKPQPK